MTTVEIRNLVGTVELDATKVESLDAVYEQVFDRAARSVREQAEREGYELGKQVGAETFSPSERGPQWVKVSWTWAAIRTIAEE